MTRVKVSRTIAASVDRVFDAVTNIENFPKKDSDVVGVEFLTDQRTGVGTRFIETRRMGKKEMKTELEVTEWVENESVRMVTDSHGTIWDSLFALEEGDGFTLLSITMDARTDRLFNKVMNAVMKGFYRRGMRKHLNALADYLE